MTAAEPIAVARPLVLGASVAGPSHLRDGRPCQDAFAVRSLDGDGLVIAVADGLGSAARAEAGARIAVDAAVAGDGLPVEQRVATARIALEERAATQKWALRDLACTLIVAIMTGEDTWTAHVGDGGVVARTAEGLALLSGPAPSEYVNEVDPLTGDGWAQALRVAGPVPGVGALLAFTDGCAHAVLTAAGEPHPGFVDAVLAWAGADGATEDELGALLAGTKLSEHSDDDKTLVLALLGP